LIFTDALIGYLSQFIPLSHAYSLMKPKASYFEHFSNKIAINRSPTFQKFLTFGKFFFVKTEIAGLCVKETLNLIITPFLT
jgi:hypothetical protein